MSDTAPNEAPKTAAPAPKPPEKPAAPPPKGAPAPAPKPVEKPTPEQRDREEHKRALLRAQADREALVSTRKELDGLRQQLEGLKGLDVKERQRIAELAKTDLAAALRELGTDLPTATKTFLAKGGRTADPRDEVIGKLQKEIDSLKGFVEETKKEREERLQRETAAEEKAQSDRVYDQIHGGMAFVVEKWEKVPPASDVERTQAAGDELLLSELRRNPEGWRAELVAFAKKNANATGEQVRAHYGALLLRQQQERAKLRFVGALLGGSTTDAPTSQQGGHANADVPRTRTRKLSGGAGSDDPPATKPTKHGLAQDEIDALRRAPRRMGR